MRVHHWQDSLTRHILHVQRKMDDMELVFSYNMKDPKAIHCVTFALGCAELIGAPRIQEAFEGYTTPAGALKKMLKTGATDLPSYFAKYFPEKGLAHVHKGDIVLVPSGGGLGNQLFPLAAAIAEPPHFWGLTEDGLGFGDLSLITHAFAVESLPEDEQGNHVGHEHMLLRSSERWHL